MSQNIPYLAPRLQAAYLETLAWPAEQAHHALDALAKHSRLSAHDSANLITDTRLPLAERLHERAKQLGLEVQPVSLTYGDVERFLYQAAPALIAFKGGYLAVLRGGRRLVVVAPSGRLERVAWWAIRDEWVAGYEQTWQASLERFSDAVQIPTEQRPKTRRVTLTGRLAGEPVGSAWLLRLSSSASFATMSRLAHLPRYAGASVIAGLVAFTLQIIGLSLFTQAAQILVGAEAQILLGGFLWLFSIPFYSASLRYAFELGPLFSIQLEQRLFQEALHHQPNESNSLRLMGWVLEAKTFEDSILKVSVQTLQLVMTLLPLLGLLILSGPWLVAVGLVGWTALAVVVVALLAREYIHIRRGYLDLTFNTLDWMQGHLTRLVQERHWLHHEDRVLSQYHRTWGRYDRKRVAGLTLIGGGWFVIGLLALLPLYQNPTPETAPLFAIGITAILWAFVQIEAIPNQLEQLIRVIGAWFILRPQNHPQTATATPVLPLVPPNDNALQAEGVTYRYPQRQQAALAQLSVNVRTGDKIWLMGEEGAGKSTLAALLTQWFTPTSGQLSLYGLSADKLSANDWRKRVVGVASWEHNRILSASLAFNLLLGRGWPASAADLQDAHALCTELGLGDLLAAMPNGLHEEVGEQGWQLSHGEQARVLIARALLQKPDILILDDSLNALDPATAHRVLTVVHAHARTVIVLGNLTPTQGS